MAHYRDPIASLGRQKTVSELKDIATETMKPKKQERKTIKEKYQDQRGPEITESSKD